MSDPGLSREELLAALDERDVVISVLLVRIADLERRVGMDSSNSSMPPGSDGPAARARRAKQRKKNPSPRPRGGQAGHEGRGLERVAVPDRIEVLTPGACSRCSAGLAGIGGRVRGSVQVFDTPPVKLEVTEYRMLAVTCRRCAAITRAETPAGMHGPCCYGPNVRAATALLTCNGHMSVERAADLMGVLLDAPVSSGFAGGLVKRVARTLTGFESALKDRLRAAPVMHHDETPARVSGDDADRLLYIYTARADKLIWFGAADNRGHAALDGFGILPGFHGTLVRDDYAAYAKYDPQLAGVQLCCAHLIRSLRGISELDREFEKIQRCWTEPIQAALLEAKAAVATAPHDRRRSPGPGSPGRPARTVRHRGDLGNLDQPGPRLAQWPTSRLHPGPPTPGPRRAGLALHHGLRRAVHQQPGRTAPTHGQTPDEDRRVLAQRAHRRPLLPGPFLPGHRPPPRHPSPRRTAQCPRRATLDAASNHLISQGPEWIRCPSIL